MRQAIRDRSFQQECELFEILKVGMRIQTISVGFAVLTECITDKILFLPFLNKIKQHYLVFVLIHIRIEAKCYFKR